MIDTIRVSGHGILMDVSLIVYSQHANEDVEKMILGNKCDMGDRRVVSKERGDQVRIRHICYSPAGRSVLGKTVPEVLDPARGRRPRAVLKTEGTVFPNTDRPRLVNDIFIFFLNRTKGMRKTRTF